MIERVTESSSNHSDLDKKSTLELLSGMNAEDKTVPLAVEKILGLDVIETYLYSFSKDKSIKI